MQREERIEDLFLSTQNLIRGWKAYFYKVLKPEGLSPALMMLLFYIGNREAVNGRSIGTALDLSPSAVSQLIEGLHHLGYVAKETRPEDRRATYFSLTEAGEQKLADLEDKKRKFFMALTAGLSDSEIEAMIGLQQKLIDKIHTVSTTGTQKEVVK